MRAITAGILALALVASEASAQTSIKIGCSPTPDCVNAMIAIEEGIFKKNGIDAEMVVVAINSNIPAALLSDSIQFGGPTPTVFLQSIDGGLDLAGVGSAAVMTKAASDSFALMVKPDSNLRTAKDLAGKRVAVPGFNALLHVYLRHWLALNGVDPKSVNFIEGSFPAMGDLLKAGTVDAIISGQPFMGRVVEAKTGVIMANFLADIPDGSSLILYAANRRWAEANPKIVAAFRASIAEGAKIANSDPEKVRAAAGRFLKMPPAVAATIVPGRYDPGLDARQIGWWLDVMSKQSMLQTKIDPEKTLLK